MSIIQDATHHIIQIKVPLAMGAKVLDKLSRAYAYDSYVAGGGTDSKVRFVDKQIRAKIMQDYRRIEAMDLNEAQIAATTAAIDAEVSTVE